MQAYVQVISSEDSSVQVISSDDSSQDKNDDYYGYLSEASMLTAAHSGSVSENEVGAEVDLVAYEVLDPIQEVAESEDEEENFDESAPTRLRFIEQADGSILRLQIRYDEAWHEASEKARAEVEESSNISVAPYNGPDEAWEDMSDCDCEDCSDFEITQEVEDEVRYVVERWLPVSSAAFEELNYPNSGY